jgi:hypothetical protein
MSEELDIMQQMDAIDLSKVETDFPLLATGVVSAQIQTCEWKRDTEKKGDDAKPYCRVKYNLTQEWKTSGHNADVKVLQPGARGMTISEDIYVGKYTDKEGNEQWYGLDRLAKLREAVFGKAQPGTKFNPAEMPGQPITLRLKFDPRPVNSKTKEVYGPRTSVEDYVRGKR